MVKLKEWGTQGNNITATIIFEYGGDEHEETVSALISQVLNMTPEQIKAWMRNFADNKIKEKQLGSLKSLLDPLVGVELEE